MDMDGTTEEFVGSTTSNNHDASAAHIVKAKGKRTKRQRPLSPLNCALAATMMTSSSSTASGDDHHVSDGGDYGSFSSTTTTYESTEEEEDMANCLILLAQGGDPHNPKQPDQDQAGNHTHRGSSSSRRFAEMAPTAAASKTGFYIYECKTCNRTFPSFQALGGHRASHKKPKPSTVEEKKLPPPPPSPQVTSYELEDAGKADIKSSPPISLQFNKAVHSNKAKIHECSICGSEFTSGQALGGHMRRHRASTNNSTQVVAAAVAAAAEEVKPRNVLQLDLNLPAPEDVDLRDSKFQFKATQKSLVLSAPPLVGCHY